MAKSVGISVGTLCGDKTTTVMRVMPRSTSCDSRPRSLPPESIFYIDGFIIGFMFTSLEEDVVYELGI